MQCVVGFRALHPFSCSGFTSSAFQFLHLKIPCRSGVVCIVQTLVIPLARRVFPCIKLVFHVTSVSLPAYLTFPRLQVRTFVEMDSHEEKVYQAVRQTQEREAKQKMREKAKELQRQKYEAQKRGVSSMSYSGGGGSGSINVMPQVSSISSRR